RISSHHGNSSNRDAIGRSLRQALRTDAGPGSELLWHRRGNPAEGGWQSFGSARQSFQGAARSQKNASQNSGDVARGKGVRCYHWSATDHRNDISLPDFATIHHLAIHSPDGPRHVGRIRGVDEYGRTGDEKND